MSDIASNDLALDNTPRGSPSPHNQHLLLETTESYPAATENYAATYDEDLLAASATPLPHSLTSSPSARVTRTVAIIKPHALPHRFDIEHRISEAGFEVRCHASPQPPSDAYLTRCDRDRTYRL